MVEKGDKTALYGEVLANGKLYLF